jgi:hypothetical protein
LSFCTGENRGIVVTKAFGVIDLKLSTFWFVWTKLTAKQPDSDDYLAPQPLERVINIFAMWKAVMRNNGGGCLKLRGRYLHLVVRFYDWFHYIMIANNAPSFYLQSGHKSKHCSKFNTLGYIIIIIENVIQNQMHLSTHIDQNS